MFIVVEICNTARFNVNQSATGHAHGDSSRESDTPTRAELEERCGLDNSHSDRSSCLNLYSKGDVDNYHFIISDFHLFYFFN